MGEHVNIQQMVLFYSLTLYSFHMLQHGSAWSQHKILIHKQQSFAIESDRTTFSRNLHLISDCSKTEQGINVMTCGRGEKRRKELMDCTPGYLFLQNYLTHLCALRDVYL